jgi:hypothetical protein
MTAVSIAVFTVPALGSDNFSINNTNTQYEEWEEVENDTSIPETHTFKAKFGPFFVIDANNVEMNGIVDESTPIQFRKMMVQFPMIKTLHMIDCPGTENDEANLSLARMVRRARLNTHVPANGSIRSGGVELFLAGIKRTRAPGAEFGVHSWQDEDGREAGDVAAGILARPIYENYYVDMGFDPATARQFYAFTNATPANSIHYMTEHELAQYHLTN